MAESIALNIEPLMAHRALVALQVYEAVFAHTESFEPDDIGVGLAYLLGAILSGKQWAPSVHLDMTLVGLLEKNLPETHAVWETAVLDPRHISKKARKKHET